MLRLPIHTPRLLLRDFVAADATAVFTYASDPEVVEHMFYAPWSSEQAVAYIDGLLVSQQALPRRLWELAIVERDSGMLLGSVDLTPVTPTATGDADAEPEADLGYILARTAWGKGYATEAAVGLLDAGFARLQLRRVVAVCAVENLASRRVLEKAGLQHIDTVQHYRQTKGRDFAVHRFAMTRAQWLAHTRTLR